LLRRHGERDRDLRQLLARRLTQLLVRGRLPLEGDELIALGIRPSECEQACRADGEQQDDDDREGAEELRPDGCGDAREKPDERVYARKSFRS
jgi:hypothetical protein